MAFQATIASITPIPDPSGTRVDWSVTVNFADSASNFVSTKIYVFPMGTSQATAVAQITADGTNLKASLLTASSLQSKVGTVITI